MKLENFFKEHNKVALAFSGGVDSAYLLYAALKYGAKVRAYYVNSQFQPDFEVEDAKRLAEELGAEMKIINCDILSCKEVVANPENRCYYCKNQIFGKIIQAAKADGYEEILDGTNASDETADRPGMKALREMKVLSPLRACDLDKKTIRNLSKEAELFTWNKPSYACLATRIASGEIITAQDLRKVESSEAKLSKLGFSDFRVRIFHGAAKLQLKEEQLEMGFSKRKEIREALEGDFQEVLLDLKER